MVRNTPSTHSLRDASSPSPSMSQPQSIPYQVQRLDRLQLCGNDDYTKALMTRVATGQATDEELGAFQKQVQDARSLPSIQHLLQPTEASAHQDAGATRRPHPSYPPGPEKNERLVDHQMQLMLAEQQREKRLLMEREETLGAHDAVSSESGSDGETELQDHQPDHFLAEEDYQMQLMLLEQQNKRRLLFDEAQLQDHQPHHFLAKEDYQMQLMLLEQQNKKRCLLAKSEKIIREGQKATRENAAKYTKRFTDFMTENPTVFHCVASMKEQLSSAGWTELNERGAWKIEAGKSYYVSRNDSSLIAFVVGKQYEPGNGAAIIAGHVDAITAKLKPVSQVPNKAGYLQLGVAPYAGGLNSTWWDRDLGIGGRVHVKEGDKIVTKLVKISRPIAKIPTLAPHFGAAARGPFDTETQMVPIVGLESAEPHAEPSQSEKPFSQPSLLESSAGAFVRTQPPALVRAITKELGISSDDEATIVGWELELYDVQPATVSGLNEELISAGRIDDKLCSWAALQALLENAAHDNAGSSLIKVVGMFDNEEIGSLLRQGARGNFLPSVMERAVSSLTGETSSSSWSELMGRTYANSFLVSSDVSHAVNPNFIGAYLENHTPHLNVGITVHADANGHMTTDSVSTSILKRCADKVGAKLQVFQVRNGQPSGGTIGPMLSSALGCRAIDAGVPQLSMHSIRATTGALDPGLGVLTYLAFLNNYEEVDKGFQSNVGFR